MKTEGNSTIMDICGVEKLRLYGYSGHAAPLPQSNGETLFRDGVHNPEPDFPDVEVSLFNFKDSNDIIISNLQDSPMRLPDVDFSSIAGYGADPRKWTVLQVDNNGTDGFKFHATVDGNPIDFNRLDVPAIRPVIYRQSVQAD